jgi:hypothetical protein
VITDEIYSLRNRLTQSEISEEDAMAGFKKPAEAKKIGPSDFVNF